MFFLLTFCGYFALGNEKEVAEIDSSLQSFCRQALARYTVLYSCTDIQRNHSLRKPCDELSMVASDAFHYYFLPCLMGTLWVDALYCFALSVIFTCVCAMQSSVQCFKERKNYIIAIWIQHGLINYSTER